MRRAPIFAAVVFLVTMNDSWADETKLPSYDAPFGLHFGMTQQEVKLPVARPPETSQRLPTDELLGAPAFGTVDQRQRFISPKAQYAALIDGCRATFERVFFLYFRDESWTSWIAGRTTLDNLLDALDDIRPEGILEKAQIPDLYQFREAVEYRGIPEPTDFYSVSIHTLKAAGKERNICLVFTKDGLSHVFMLQDTFADVIEEIYQHLGRNQNYTDYSSSRLRKQNKMRSGYYAITERNFWIDKERNILISAKNINVEKGFGAKIRTLMMKEDYLELGMSELVPYIAYTDLARRAQTFRRYRNHTIVPLTNAISEAKEIDSALRKDEAERERARSDKEAKGRKDLIEGFR